MKAGVVRDISELSMLIQITRMAESMQYHAFVIAVIWFKYSLNVP